MVCDKRCTRLGEKTEPVTYKLCFCMFTIRMQMGLKMEPRIMGTEWVMTGSCSTRNTLWYRPTIPVSHGRRPHRPFWAAALEALCGSFFTVGKYLVKVCHNKQVTKMEGAEESGKAIDVYIRYDQITSQSKIMWEPGTYWNLSLLLR